MDSFSPYFVYFFTLYINIYVSFFECEFSEIFYELCFTKLVNIHWDEEIYDDFQHENNWKMIANEGVSFILIMFN